MADVTLNSAVRSNLRTLQSTTDLMNRTEERLSTGKKVNSAFDNPGSFFTSQALDRRASDLNGLLDNVSNSVKTLEAADNGIKAITDVVESLKASARQALQAEKLPDVVATATNDFAAIAAGGADQVFQINGEDVTVEEGDSLDDVITSINGNADLEGVTASKDGNKLVLTSSDDITIAGTTTAVGTLADAEADTTSEAYKKREAFRSDFNEALNQISDIAKDSNFNGVNLLKGDDLSVVFNEDGTSKLDVTGTDFDFAGLGLSEVAEGGFGSKESIDTVLTQIESAFSTLESQSSKFGSQLQIVQTRQSFTKDMIGTLEDGSSALTSADTNAEAANLATLQTRQSLIVSALSISTSQEQNVLQLLR